LEDFNELLLNAGPLQHVHFGNLTVLKITTYTVL
jgi:hypothetical protein